MELDYAEIQMVAAALQEAANNATHDIPHWTFGKTFQQFQRRVNLVARGKEFITIHTTFIGGLPIGEEIHRDQKTFKVVNNDSRIVTTAIRV